MSIIDRQRVAAVCTLERLGFTFSLADGWMAPPNDTQSIPAAEAENMRALLVLRADALAGCAEGTNGAAELKMIITAAEAYEAERWPHGRVGGGKG